MKSFRNARNNAQKELEYYNLDSFVITLQIAKKSKGIVYTSQFMYHDEMPLQVFKIRAIENIWQDYKHNIDDVDLTTDYTIICK